MPQPRHSQKAHVLAVAQLVYSLLAEPCHLANQRYAQAAGEHILSDGSFLLLDNML